MKKTKKHLSLNAETVRILKEDQLKAIGGGETNTCLGQTNCLCGNTFNTQCPSAYTCGLCSVANTNCGCVGTAYKC